jgi:hypothetical protein
MMSQLTGIVAVRDAAPETFVTLTTKEVPVITVPTDKTNVPERPDVKKIREFAVSDVVATVAIAKVDPFAMLVTLAVNVPTDEEPAATTVPAFPTRIFAGRRDPCPPRPRRAVASAVPKFASRR